MMEQLTESWGAVVFAGDPGVPKASGASLICACEKRLMLFPPGSSHEVALANVDACQVMSVIGVAAACVIVCCRRHLVFCGSSIGIGVGAVVAISYAWGIGLFLSLVVI
jgi:hypothetical protein